MTNRNSNEGLSRPNRYDASAYVSGIKLSKMPILLVEGQSDVKFFECLHNALNLEDVRIDDANFKIPGGRENRRRNVEYVSADIVANHPQFADRFIGFADREFDCFDIEQDSIVDHVNSQRHTGRLVYSRGHSIENYVFDYNLIVDVLESCYPISSSYRATAIGYIKDYFDQIICIACAVSLAAKEMQRLHRISEALSNFQAWDNDTRIVSYNGDARSVKLNPDGFSARILRNAVAPEEEEGFFERYNHYLEIINGTENRETIRWVCHGHIGLHIIRIAYAMFIYYSWDAALQTRQANPPISQIDSMLRSWNWITDRNTSWIQYYSSQVDKNISPAYCFAELGVLG